MKVTTDTRMVIILVLSYREANWLRAVMQNPLPGESSESDEDIEMRRTFFEAVKEAK